MLRKNQNNENEIALINIFESINGEGYAAGKPTVFIRTFGCNLRCSFCFAKGPSGKFPFVIDSSGQIKHLNQVQIGEQILTKNPKTNRVETCTVTKVMFRYVESVQNVIFGGTSEFNVTKEHPFYSRNDWVAIENLKEGEIVTSAPDFQISNYFNRVDTEVDFNVLLTQNVEKRGQFTVVNLETSSHSYLVKSDIQEDAILVHNCDTKESWTKQNLLKVYPERSSWEFSYMWKTAKQIFDQVEEIEKDYFHKSICLTGGEPLLEENKDFMINELLPLFVNAGYDIGIETDGGIDYTDYKKKFGDSKIINVRGDRQGITIIADYKLPYSGMTHKMIKSNFATYSEYDIIKLVISDDPQDWKELDWIVNNSGTKADIYLSPCFGEVTMHRLPEYVIAHPDKKLRVQLQQHKFFWSPKEKDV